jgi:hypothetical protein
VVRYLSAVAAPELLNAGLGKGHGETEIGLSPIAGVVADFNCASPGEQEQFPRLYLNPPLSQGNDLSPAHYQYSDGLVDRDIT